MADTNWIATAGADLFIWRQAGFLSIFFPIPGALIL